MRGLSRGAKVALIAIPAVVVLAVAGAGIALKLSHDSQVRKDRAAAAKREARARDEREAQESIDKLQEQGRKDAVKELETSVSKDAKKNVNEGILDGPILTTQCDALSGGPEDLSADKGTFECLAANQKNDDGTIEGYRYSASVDYESGSLRWRLGGD